MGELERLLEKGETDKAKNAAERVLAQRPQDPSALVVLAKVALMEGQLDKAESLIARAEALGITPETLLMRANLAGQRGQLEAAAAAFRQVLAREPKRAEAHFGLGLVLFKQGKEAEALASLKEAVRQNPQHTVFVYRLGQVQLEMGRIDEGIQTLARACTLQHGFLPPYLSLIEALVDQGRTLDARRVLTEALSKFPSHPRLLARLTALSLGMGSMQVSYRAASALAAQRPKDPQAQANLALLLLLRGQHEDALRLCRTMDNLGLATADLKILEATAHEAHEPPAYDAAEAAYEEAMGMDPEGWKAPSNLGQLLMRRPGEPPEQHMPRAITVLEEAVRRKPEQPEPHLNLALAYTRTGNKAQARAQAQKVLDTQPPAAETVREQAERLLKALG